VYNEIRRGTYNLSAVVLGIRELGTPKYIDPRTKCLCHKVSNHKSIEDHPRSENVFIIQFASEMVTASVSTTSVMVELSLRYKCKDLLTP